MTDVRGKMSWCYTKGN